MYFNKQEVAHSISRALMLNKIESLTQGLALFPLRERPCGSGGFVLPLISKGQGGHQDLSFLGHSDNSPEEAPSPLWGQTVLHPHSHTKPVFWV